VTITARDLSVPRPIDLATPVPLGSVALDELDHAKILAAPDDPRRWPAWRATLQRWRADARERHSHYGSAYDSRPSWMSTCASIRLVWLWDERLYDRASGRFTVDESVDAVERDFGGFDAVVLRHAYPVIGLDPRNQWDFYRDMPELADVVARFQARGQRVFVDDNPWDSGTRRAVCDDAAELAALVGDYGVDGVFLDTLKEGSAELVERLGADVAVCGESRVSRSRRCPITRFPGPNGSTIPTLRGYCARTGTSGGT
jgi:sulfatase modifying factor 1